MNPLRRLLASTPRSQIYQLFIVFWLVVLLSGFGFFLVQSINQRLERLAGLSELVMAVTAPVLADATLANKGVLIQQMLDVTAQSPFIHDLSIISPSGDVQWQSVGTKPTLMAPVWLNNRIQSLLPAVQKPLLVDGRLVGSLRLSFETQTLANNFLHLLGSSLLLALLLAGFGVMLGLIPLRLALQNLSAFCQQAEVTLLAIHEGVISCTEISVHQPGSPGIIRL